jgi:hypothetical protein
VTTVKIIAIPYNGRPYYMPADSISPYCTVDQDPKTLPRPFVATCIHPSCGIGIPLPGTGRYVVDIPPQYPPKKQKHWRNILNRNHDTTLTFQDIPPGKADHEFLTRIAGPFFQEKEIDEEMVKASSTYTRQRPGILLTVTTNNDEWIASDYSAIEDNTVYGVVCHWNHNHAHRHPGTYCVLKLIEYCQQHGYQKYDLGGLGYGYKQHLATRTEPSLGIVLADPPYDELPEAIMYLHGIQYDPTTLNKTK